MTDLAAILLGLTTGITMSVAISCVWVVLGIPARLQDRLGPASCRSLTISLFLGMVLSALNNALGLTLPLPAWCGSAGLLLGGMFVGMLASALGEILEVAPVMMHRLRLGDLSTGVRFVLLLGKGLGAVLAAMAFSA